MSNHDFLLIDKLYLHDEKKLEELKDNFFYKNKPDIYTSAEISDDLILYINDTLKFFKSIFVSKEEKEGLDYYGYSLIYGENLLKAKIIFEAWKNIFYQSNSSIHLERLYYVDSNNQEYNKLKFNKEEVIFPLYKLSLIFDYAYKKDLVVLHLGI